MEFLIPVFARASMGVIGANFPAMVRGIVAIFWYGAQTYFASTAVALLLNSLFGISGGGEIFGMTTIGWISLILVAGFQIYLFWNGIDLIRRFLKFCWTISLRRNDYINASYLDGGRRRFTS